MSGFPLIGQTIIVKGFLFIKLKSKKYILYNKRFLELIEKQNLL